MKRITRTIAAVLAVCMLASVLPLNLVSQAWSIDDFISGGGSQTEDPVEETAEETGADVQDRCVGRAEIDAGRAVLGERADEFKQYMFERFALCETEIDVESYNISTADLSKVLDLIYYSMPESFQYQKSLTGVSAGGKVLTINVPQYYMTSAQYAAKLQDLRAAGARLLSGILGNGSLNTMQKIVLAHDRLAEYMAYTTASKPEIDANHYLYDTAYAGLVNRTGNCQGYAVTFQYLMDLLGIENYYVTSDSLDHSWNLVYTNGKAYFVDVAFDDPFYDIPGRIRHLYLLVSANSFRTNHVNERHPDPVYDFEALATDTSLDNEFWHNSETAFTLLGNTIYYIDSRLDNAYLREWNGTWHHTLITAPDGKTNYWFTGEKTACPLNMARLTAWGNKLIVTEPHAVYVYDPAAKEYTEVFRQSDNRKDLTSIYGMKYESPYLYLYYYTPSSSADQILFAPDQPYSYRMLLTEDSAPVVVSVSSLTATPSSLQITKGSTASVKVTVNPGNATDQVLTWSVADGSKVDVIGGGSNPVIVGLELGTTSITVKSSNNKQVVIPVEVVCGHAWTKATCTAPETCSICGETRGEALGHNLIHHDAKAATCTEIGWSAYDTCSRCDYTTYEEIEALGHDLIRHDAKAATCTEIGWNAYDTCSRCDYTTYEEIEALGHDLLHHDAKAATCTEIGWNAYDTCSRCDYTTYVETAALGHVWGEVSYQWSEDNKTCTASRVCSVCGEVESETVDATLESNYYQAAFTNEAFEAQNTLAFLWGDANGDGVISNKDVVRLKNYLANYDEITGRSSVELFPGADANGDGVISNKDVVRLKNYLANYDEITGLSSVILGPA